MPVSSQRSSRGIPSVGFRHVQSRRNTAILHRWFHLEAATTARPLHRFYRDSLYGQQPGGSLRSEEHTSELQSLMRISYAVFCLKKKIQQQLNQHIFYTNQCLELSMQNPH